MGGKFSWREIFAPPYLLFFCIYECVGGGVVCARFERNYFEDCSIKNVIEAKVWFNVCQSI